MAYRAKQCGITLEPPALVLVYQEIISQKMRRRLMPIRDLLSKSTSAAETAAAMRDRHKRYLENVPLVMIEKMMRILQEYAAGHDLNTALDRVTPEFEVGSNEDLNVLSERSLQRKKAFMEVAFNKRRLRPEDKAFEYDKRVEFPSVDQCGTSEWDLDLSKEDQDPPLPASSVDCEIQEEDEEEDFWG